ncbi:hypothetical protein L1049_021403 [Liquidambar formosana]|uniref:Uncharacterized protein n=1 Tax=Liquidambar formosana TaxID=63359 RepID=A0AAP0N6N7_LIQFO
MALCRGGCPAKVASDGDDGSRWIWGCRWWKLERLESQWVLTRWEWVSGDLGYGVHSGVVGARLGFGIVMVIRKVGLLAMAVDFGGIPVWLVHEWVATKPTTSDLQSIYGSGKVLPTITIILPFKPAKVEAVKKQLSRIHPEIILFLHKIKRESIRENRGGSYTTDSVSAISISSEMNLISLRSHGANSRIVLLSVQEEADATENTCRYYIWRQVFPVKPDNMVDARKDIKELVISLAFPFGKRLKRGTSSVGIFAFLPTAMVTNFPFVVQADFILSSSRQNILMDNKWNMGILDNVPSCFVSALTTFMKSSAIDEFFSIYRVFDFLLVRESPYKELNRVRQSIKSMLQKECIVPYESFLNDKMVFCEPTNAIRILAKFRKILSHIKEHNVCLSDISSQGKFVLHDSVDHKEYDEIWNFLGVPSVDDCNEWYGKCIQAYHLMFKASTRVYVKLLCFLANNWKHFPLRSLNSIPLVKYITWNGETKACSVLEIKREKLKIHLVWEAEQHAWLSKWNLEMG